MSDVVGKPTLGTVARASSVAVADAGHAGAVYAGVTPRWRGSTASPTDHLSRRPGFTLVELLVVVVIIALLASIAIPKFQNTKGKANLAAMKSDLRNLASAEEAYMFDHGTYVPAVSQLSFSTSPGVQLTILTATTSGWSAQATHPASYPLTCAIFAGQVAVPSPAVVEGLIACQ